MTLNDNFALKSVSGSATNELAFLAFGQNCSQIWSVKPVNCIYSFALTVSQFSLMLLTDACKYKNNYAGTWM